MATRQLDITQYSCPLTFVKVKVRLYELDKGDILEVLLTGGEPLENVPAAVTRDGHVVLGAHHVAGNTYCLRIRK